MLGACSSPIFTRLSVCLSGGVWRCLVSRFFSASDEHGLLCLDCDMYHMRHDIFLVVFLTFLNSKNGFEIRMVTFGGGVNFQRFLDLGIFYFYFKVAVFSLLFYFFKFQKMVLKWEWQLFLTFIDLRFILDFWILKVSFWVSLMIFWNFENGFDIRTTTFGG